MNLELVRGPLATLLLLRLRVLFLVVCWLVGNFWILFLKFLYTLYRATTWLLDGWWAPNLGVQLQLRLVTLHYPVSFWFLLLAWLSFGEDQHSFGNYGWTSWDLCLIVSIAIAVNLNLHFSASPDVSWSCSVLREFSVDRMDVFPVVVTVSFFSVCALLGTHWA